MKSSKKVLFISNVPSPYNISYLNELGKLREVTAVFERGFSSERDKSWKDLNIKDFECVILKGLKTSADMALSLGVIKYIKKFTKELVIIANPSTPTGIVAILYCKLMRIPYILQSEGGIPKNGKGIKEKFKYFLMHSARMYLSGMIKNDYFLAYGATKDNIFHYPFASLYEKDILKEIPTIEEKSKIKENLGVKESVMILYVGRFIEGKGVDFLLNACKGISEDTVLYAVGGKCTDEYLKIMASTGFKNVHYIDFLVLDKLKEYYMAADIFVLPTRGDTWGLVINEAMSMGVSVITTTDCVAGNQLIEDGENGFLVKTDDIDMLHSRLEMLINSPEKRKKFADKAFKIIKDYTFENMAFVINESLKKLD